MLVLKLVIDPEKPVNTVYVKKVRMNRQVTRGRQISGTVLVPWY